MNTKPFRTTLTALLTRSLTTALAFVAISTLFIGLAYASSQVFITEIADPQNSGDAGRYVELHNAGTTEINLDNGWGLQRWTNANTTPQTVKPLQGTIAPGGFFIVCSSASKFAATYTDVSCDQDLGTGGPADSNGDDNIALVLDGAVIDMFGVAGEKGSGTDHEFEDGRAERALGVTQANATYDASEWNIDHDSGGGDGPQYAPEGFDPGFWIGSQSIASCEDAEACNTGEAGDCQYVNVGWGNMQWPPTAASAMAYTDSETIYGMVWIQGITDPDGAVEGLEAELGYGPVGSLPDDSWTWSDAAYDSSLHGALAPVNDQYAGTLNITTPGDYIYSYRYRYNSSCWYYADETGAITITPPHTVTFQVDMTWEGNPEFVYLRGLEPVGSWSAPGIEMTNSGNGIWTADVGLPPGHFIYKFAKGGSMESVDDLECAEEVPNASGTFTYWDRYVDVSGDTTLPVDCFSACGACSVGCTNPNATNYDPDATNDDDSCEFPQVDPDNIFITEAAEGSGNNKYIEIYNATDAAVSLNNYQFKTCSNGCEVADEWEYTNSFDTDASIAPGDVYVLCHGSADPAIQAECDGTFTYLSSGNDAFALYHSASDTVIDTVGAMGDDPGCGWDVAGEVCGTKDHTLVRKSTVNSGNNGDWSASAGTNAGDSEWIVLEKNDWSNVGAHYPLECNSGDVNGDGAANILDILLMVQHILEITPLGDVDCAADFNDDGNINIFDIMGIIAVITAG